MNILLKLIAVAAAFGLAPATAAAQDVTAPPVQTLPAQPQDVVAPEPDAQSMIAAEPVGASLLRAEPEAGIGQPDGRMGLQTQFSEIGEEAAWFHDIILTPIITLISIFVLALMIWVVIRYRRAANPVPSRTTHNTMLEVVWTLVPVLILVAIAVPSIKLLANQYDPPEADLTIKVIGNQWYWTYQYPDHGDFELVSNMLGEPGDVPAGTRSRTDADGPRLLAVDERIVVPVGATVKLIVTSADVLHSFAVPAFWVKMDAVPGRLNETWFKVDRPGVYYGQCSELCGARHGYMPIAVEVVPPAQFAAWVASKGGTMPGGAAPTSPDATANSPLDGAGTDMIGATEGSETNPAPMNVIDAVATPPVTNQAAATTNGGGSQQ